MNDTPTFASIKARILVAHEAISSARSAVGIIENLEKASRELVEALCELDVLRFASQRSA